MKISDYIEPSIINKKSSWSVGFDVNIEGNKDVDLVRSNLHEHMINCNSGNNINQNHSLACQTEKNLNTSVMACADIATRSHLDIKGPKYK